MRRRDPSSLLLLPFLILLLLGVLVAVDAAAQADLDGDGVLEPEPDNCDYSPLPFTTYNPAQFDSDSDGFGNVCDPDYDNNGGVGISDLSLLMAALGPTTPATLNMDACDDTPEDPCTAVFLREYVMFLLHWMGTPGP